MIKIDSSDLERLKKIAKNYEDLKRQIDTRNITREQVLSDQFIQGGYHHASSNPPFAASSANASSEEAGRVLDSNILKVYNINRKSGLT